MSKPALKPEFDLVAHRVAQTRANLQFAHAQGGTEHYSYEAIAARIRKNRSIGLAWDKSACRDFMVGDTVKPRVSPHGLEKMFLLSDLMAGEVRFHLNDAAQILKTPQPDTPSRLELVNFVRERVRLANTLGGKDLYSLEKLAVRINDAVSGMKWDKGAVGLFLREPDMDIAHLSLEKLVTLMQWSVDLMDEMRPHIARAQALLSPPSHP